MSETPHINAKISHNVHVIVGEPLPNGKLIVKQNKLFKNTATRLMTQSIAEYLAGSEDSYNRKHGRPNFMGFGTMGITKQNNLDAATVTSGFDATNPPPEDRTRPWFESTSLALTDTCGMAALYEDGTNKHFWHPKYGWDDPSFSSTHQTFQGELCTDPGAVDIDKGWNVIERLPILRTEVASDCPQDLDYGSDGYASSVIFYGYASVDWVNKLLRPTELVTPRTPANPDSTETKPVGPQLDRMGISEFGLYEKNNTDPHGLHTLFAVFRVPSAKDIVYVSANEVILVEWRVTIRALMQYEAVAWDPSIVNRPKGISLEAIRLPKDEQDNNYIRYNATVVPAEVEFSVPQRVEWSLTTPTGGTPTQSSFIYINNEGVETTDTNSPYIKVKVGAGETEDILFVNAAFAYDRTVKSRSAIITGMLTDYVFGIELSGTIDSSDTSKINFVATVKAKGSVTTGVTWRIESGDPGVPLDANTRIDSTSSNTATLTISAQEQVRHILITCTSAYTTDIYTKAAVIRMGQTEGAYVISDFTILT